MRDLAGPLAGLALMLLAGAGAVRADDPGAQIYTDNCAACHMADGTGVSGMQPALVNDPVLKGDPQVLMRVVLLGPDKVLPANRPAYSNMMPAFARLSDGDLAALLTYLRKTYGRGAAALTPDQVKAVRTSSNAGTT